MPFHNSYHKISTIDDPNIKPNKPGGGSSNNQNNNNSNNSNQNSNQNPPVIHIVTGGNSNNNNGNPTINGTSIKSVLNKKNQIPDLLIDYEKLAKQKKIHTISFRENLTNRLITTLTTKNHPNALLVGDAGVGKTAIVEDLAVRLYQNDPLVTGMLGKERKIYELPLTNLVSGSSLVGMMEAKLQSVIDFISDPKNHAILYIDEIHQLTTNTELKSVAEILKPALARNDMHVIGSTTTQELKFWQRNPALTRRFSNLIVNELSDQQTIKILGQVLPNLQNPNYPIKVDGQKLFPQLVTIANHYAKSLATHRPDSAITILDQSLALTHLQNLEIKQAQPKMQPSQELTLGTIQQAGKQLINSDQQNLNQASIKKLQTQLDNNIVGQSQAKTKLLQAIQSIVLNLIPQTKPHSFLFAGLSGTGKTEVAKQLATAIFGGPDRFIYLNMTEYASKASLTRLIGSSRGYVGSDSAQPLPLDSLKSNPFQIVLLDEFEKAAPDVQRIFMQALDEGSIQYADGSTVDFSHAIVIATTNAGTEKLSEAHIGFDPNKNVTTNELTKILTNNFPAELLNRFEYLVPFNAINKDDYIQVLMIKYQHLRHKIMQQHPEYNILPQQATPNTNFIKALAKSSYDPIKNARPAERTLQHFIEKAFLNHQNTYTIDLTKAKTD